MSFKIVSRTARRAGFSKISNFALTTFCRAMSSKELFACDYEVFGRVQGVFFRKYTAKQATSLGIHGWVMNTAAGSVKGQLEGPLNKMNEMKKWLQTTGSPSSCIDEAVFTEITPVTTPQFRSFTIRN